MDDLRSLAEPRAGVPASVPAPRSDGFSTAGPVRIFFSRFGSGNTIGQGILIYRLLPSTNTRRTLFINMITLDNHVVVIRKYLKCRNSVTRNDS